MAEAAAPRVVVVVREGCHLCDDALAVVDSVCGSLDVGWRARDLADVPEPERAEWTDLIPVVLVEGAVHDVLRVDRDRLLRALR